MKCTGGALLALLILFSSCIGDDIIFDEVDPEIRITQAVDSLAIGDSYQMEATFLNNVGKAEMVVVNWSSSDASIAAVDQNGLIEGISIGIAQITASTTQNSQVISATHKVVVGDNTVVSTASVRTGSLRTTSSYSLTGDFELSSESGALVLSFAENYEADDALPGLYVYMTNNPNTINGALEIGEVKIFEGEHSYTLPDTVEIGDFAYVLYYCKPFRVKVGDGKFDD